MKSIRKIIALFFICATALFATSITTPKASYSVGEVIDVQLKDLAGNQDDWVGIYKKGDSNDWENVVQWYFTEGFVNGTISFDNLEAETYEARVFFANSFFTEASTEFKVTNNQANHQATIATSKPTYQAQETISVSLTDLAGNQDDWVGIYLKNDSNEWENVKSWNYTGGITEGTLNMDGVATGAYEARVFFNDSFIVEAKSSFTVEGAVHHPTATTSKSTYKNDEPITVNLIDMAGNQDDWVGIYLKNDSNEWENVKSWSYTEGITEGSIRLEPIMAGEYEARVFFADTFHLEARTSFKVEANAPENQEPTVYEDAEGGMSENWAVILGDYKPKVISGGFQSAHLMELKPHWINSHENTSEYWLYTPNATQTILEMDIGGVDRRMPHFFIGAQVMTTKGERSLIWDSYFNHEHVDPFITDYGNGFIELAFPSPVEHVRGWSYEELDTWNHFKVDMQAALKQFEPDNSIISVIALKFSGGFLDNIKLSSH